MNLYTSKVGGQVPPRLREISEQVKRGEKPSAERVRTLLRWFGVERRGWNVAYDIEQVLKRLGLQTKPNFRHAYIDSEIEFIPYQETAEDIERRKSHEVFLQKLLNGKAETVTEIVANDTLAEVEFTDPTYRIGKLESANTRPLSVQPDSSLQEIITQMMTNDFSQLPVMTSERDVKGVVSWNSIGRRLAMNLQCNTARDCMEQHHEISADASLFYAIDSIIEHEYVLVRDSSKIISGIVTTTDLSMQFLQLSMPFLLLGEIENHIRYLINGKFTKDDLIKARNPGDENRQIDDISDLTFGEYVRLLENPAQWNKLDLKLDRNIFIKYLNEVRLIRNDVMHFDPDGISESDLSKLRNFVEFLQGLNKIGVI